MKPPVLPEAKLIFASYQKKFNLYLEKALADFPQKETPLGEACTYSLLNGGKRFRPALVLLLAKAAGGLDAMEAALSVELFHTSSLIADDLPCMDNDDLRRGLTSTHKKFGQMTAILASYALIAAAYDSLRKNVLLAKEQEHPFAKSHDLCSLALEVASKTLGMEGITGGQYNDLTLSKPSYSELWEVLRMKTATLFELSFCLGWIFGGGDPSLLPKVKELALHFGMAFQIADDLDDYIEDKEMGKEANMAVHLGKEKAEELFSKELTLARKSLGELPIEQNEILAVLHYLEVKGNS